MSSYDQISASNTARRKIEKVLRPGERLLWSGAPRTGLRTESSDLFAIPFGIFFLGFSVFWIAGAASSGGSRVFPLFGLPFVAVGLHLVIGRFFVDAWQRRRTVYGVSTNRVLVLTDFFSTRTKSQGLGTVADIALDERADGSGSVTFGPWGDQQASFNFSGRSSGAAPALAFRHLERCAEVYDIILKARADLLNRID